MTDDRRKHPRYRVDVPARLILDGEASDVEMRDLCRDAVLVEGDRAFAIGSRVLVRADLPDGPLEVLGRVVRVAAAENARQQMAVLFADVTPAAATQIDVFVATFSRA